MIICRNAAICLMAGFMPGAAAPAEADNIAFKLRDVHQVPAEAQLDPGTRNSVPGSLSAINMDEA
jgi:hypothetical protein